MISQWSFALRTIFVLEVSIKLRSVRIIGVCWCGGWRGVLLNTGKCFLCEGLSCIWCTTAIGQVWPRVAVAHPPQHMAHIQSFLAVHMKDADMAYIDDSGDRGW